jgi:hypothetical protein
MNNNASFKKVLDSQTISASSSVESEPLHVRTAQGYFTVESEVSGGGTIKLDYIGTLSGDSYNVPNSDASPNILSSQASSTTITSFEPPLMDKMKIRATETVGSSAATVTVWVGVQ